MGFTICEKLVIVQAWYFLYRYSQKCFKLEILRLQSLWAKALQKTLKLQTYEKSF